MDSSPLPPETIPSQPAPAPMPSRPHRKRWIWLAVAASVVTGVGIVQYPKLKAQAEAGSAYAARIGCSCRYIQGRTMDSCVTDFEPGMEIVSVSDDADSKTVTGSVPLLASRSARFQGASGCVFTPDE